MDRNARRGNMQRSNPMLQAIQRRLSQGGAGMPHPGMNVNPVMNQSSPITGQTPGQIDPGMLHPDANSMIRTMNPGQNTGTSWKQDQIGARLKKLRGGLRSGPQ